MHRSSRIILVVATFLALGQQSLAAGSGSNANGNNNNNNKELEQKYNKIFSGRSLFALDPETTRQWLKELKQQLDEHDDESQEDKHEKVRRLLVFDASDLDCDLIKGNGYELVAYYKFFATKSTSTIRTYIASCLARMYEKCRTSFVVSAEEAIGRLSESDHYERIVRFKELVEGDESDFSAPVVQFLLEQVDMRRLADEDEFKRQFKYYIGGTCEALGSGLEIMMLFDVLLTQKQIKSMGESVRQWHKARSVCKKVQLDEQGAMEKVLKRLVHEIGRENLMIRRRYKDIFKLGAWPLKPEKTFERLVWLWEKMNKVDKDHRADWSDKEREWLGNVERMIELGQTVWQTKQCNLTQARRLNQYHYKQSLDNYTPTLKRYLLNLRDQTFELCRVEVAEQVAGSVQRLSEQDPQWKKILRLKELIAKKFANNSIGRDGLMLKFYDSLLEIMDEQAGRPLSAEMNRAKFNEQLEAEIQEPCQRIKQELHFFWNVDNIWRREVVNQMDPTVRDWFLCFEVCIEEAQMEEPVYARLVARGVKTDRSRG